MVMGPSSSPAGLTRNHGRCRETGSSSPSLPSSRSCMIAVAANSLLCDAMRNFVPGAIGTPFRTSAKPNPCAQTSSWSATTPTTTPGRPR
jgi:hypothetical protein